MAAQTHQHILVNGRYFGCYPTTGPATVAREAERLGGTVATVLDTDCPNGLKPEYIAVKGADIMSKRAAVLTLVRSSTELLGHLDNEMVRLLEEIEGPEPITSEGHAEVLMELRTLARSLELQAQMGRALVRKTSALRER